LKESVTGEPLPAQPAAHNALATNTATPREFQIRFQEINVARFFGSQYVASQKFEYIFRLVIKERMGKTYQTIETLPEEIFFSSLKIQVF